MWFPFPIVQSNNHDQPAMMVPWVVPMLNPFAMIEAARAPPRDGTQTVVSSGFGGGGFNSVVTSGGSGSGTTTIYQSGEGTPSLITTKKYSGGVLVSSHGPKPPTGISPPECEAARECAKLPVAWAAHKTCTESCQAR